jgi:hypothetical protein
VLSLQDLRHDDLPACPSSVDVEGIDAVPVECAV